MLKVAAELLEQLADEMRRVCEQLREEQDSLHSIRAVLEELRPMEEICEALRLEQRSLDEAETDTARAAATLRLLAQDYLETERKNVQYAMLIAGTQLNVPSVSLLHSADLDDITLS